MAADLSLVHISMAASEEAVQDHINDLVVHPVGCGV
jgi:hypothetical protein